MHHIPRLLAWLAQDLLSELKFQDLEKQAAELFRLLNLVVKLAKMGTQVSTAVQHNLYKRKVSQEISILILQVIMVPNILS